MECTSALDSATSGGHNNFLVHSNLAAVAQRADAYRESTRYVPLVSDARAADP